MIYDLIGIKDMNIIKTQLELLMEWDNNSCLYNQRLMITLKTHRFEGLTIIILALFLFLIDTLAITSLIFCMI